MFAGKGTRVLWATLYLVTSTAFGLLLYEESALALNCRCRPNGCTGAYPCEYDPSVSQYVECRGFTNGPCAISPYNDNCTNQEEECGQLYWGLWSTDCWWEGVACGGPAVLSGDRCEF